MAEFCVYCQSTDVREKSMYCPCCQKSHRICNKCYEEGKKNGTISTEIKKYSAELVKKSV